MKKIEKVSFEVAFEKGSVEQKQTGVGRPRALEATNDVLRQLCALGRFHATYDEMAAILSVASSTFYAFLKRSPEAVIAIDKGRAEGKLSLRRSQFRMAETNATMSIFLGKNLLSQSDKIHQVTHSEIAIYIDEDDAKM